MCTPSIAIGATIGGAIGYSQGGAKGALLGAGFGAVGGAGFSVATGGVGGSYFFGSGILGASPGTNLLLASVAQGGITAGAVGGSGAVAGSSLLAQAFGGGGVGNFLLSPGFSLGTQVIGFGVNMMGQQQQAAYQQAMIANQQAQLRNRQIAVQQDITARNAALEVQLGLVSAQGAQGRGAIRAEQAGRGVLVDVGSAADRTEQLAGDVAFEKLIRKQEVALANRQDRIIASGLRTDSSLLDFQKKEAARASVFGGVGSALKASTTLSSKFRFNNGQLAFRT
jgi:hypothetical protein